MVVFNVLQIDKLSACVVAAKYNSCTQAQGFLATAGGLEWRQGFHHCHTTAYYQKQLASGGLIFQHMIIVVKKPYNSGMLCISCGDAWNFGSIVSSWFYH